MQGLWSSSSRGGSQCAIIKIKDMIEKLHLLHALINDGRVSIPVAGEFLLAATSVSQGSLLGPDLFNKFVNDL